MIYKLQPGIVDTSICGVYLLIPTRSASEVCPHIFRLSFLSELTWTLMKKEKPLEKIINIRTEFSRKTFKEEKERTEDLLRKLYEMGFLQELPDGIDDICVS